MSKNLSSKYTVINFLRGNLRNEMWTLLNKDLCLWMPQFYTAKFSKPRYYIYFTSKATQPLYWRLAILTSVRLGTIVSMNGGNSVTDLQMTFYCFGSMLLLERLLPHPASHFLCDYPVHSSTSRVPSLWQYTGVVGKSCRIAAMFALLFARLWKAS